MTGLEIFLLGIIGMVVFGSISQALTEPATEHLNNFQLACYIVCFLMMVVMFLLSAVGAISGLIIMGGNS